MAFWVDFAIKLIIAVILVKRVYGLFSRHNPVDQGVPPKVWLGTLMVLLLFQPPVFLLFIALVAVQVFSQSSALKDVATQVRTETRERNSQNPGHVRVTTSLSDLDWQNKSPHEIVQEVQRRHEELMRSQEGQKDSDPILDLEIISSSDSLFGNVVPSASQQLFAHSHQEAAVSRSPIDAKPHRHQPKKPPRREDPSRPQLIFEDKPWWQFW